MAIITPNNERAVANWLQGSLQKGQPYMGTIIGYLQSLARSATPNPGACRLLQHHIDTAHPGDFNDTELCQNIFAITKAYDFDFRDQLRPCGREDISWNFPYMVRPDWPFQAFENDESVIKHLTLAETDLEHGNPVDIPFETFKQAVKYGFHRIAREFLRLDPECVTCYEECSPTSYSYQFIFSDACASGDLKMVEAFTDHMDDKAVKILSEGPPQRAYRQKVDRQICKSNLPLYKACMSGNSDVIDLLLKKGFNLSEEVMKDCLKEVVKRGNAHALKTLLAYQASQSGDVAIFHNQNLLTKAVSSRSLLCAIIILESGDTSADQLLSAYIKAVEETSVLFIQLLVSYGLALTQDTCKQGCHSILVKLRFYPHSYKEARAVSTLCYLFRNWPNLSLVDRRELVDAYLKADVPHSSNVVKMVVDSGKPEPVSKDFDFDFDLSLEDPVPTSVDDLVIDFALVRRHWHKHADHLAETLDLNKRLPFDVHVPRSVELINKYRDHVVSADDFLFIQKLIMQDIRQEKLNPRPEISYCLNILATVVENKSKAEMAGDSWDMLQQKAMNYIGKRMTEINILKLPYSELQKIRECVPKFKSEMDGFEQSVKSKFSDICDG